MIMHVDMDAFFASVEQLDNPELVGKPVIVGGTSSRGVVAASSYEARKYGVYSAMPVFQARQKCPHGVFVKPNRSRYKEVSQQVMAILRQFTPLVEQISIDEAFMDISGCETIFGPPRDIGLKVKQEIKQSVQLTCSVGIAPLKFLAKIASDMMKPDGLTFIPEKEVHKFIETLPVKKISGVGRHTSGKLNQMGIQTLGDVKKYSREKIAGALGKYGERLYELASGIDRSSVNVSRPVKSVSTEETLAEDINDKQLLKKYLLKHSEDVGRQLRKKGRKAKTVTIKVKHSDFKQVTRQAKLPGYTFSSEKIYQAAVTLLNSYQLTKPVRLIGVGASDLDDTEQPVQMDLFHQVNDEIQKWEKVDTAVDAISDKFGKAVITKAGLVGGKNKFSDE
jgi:DNA polymerase-4